MRRQEGEARDDAAGLLPRVIVYRRTPQNLPASLLEELSRLVRYGSSGKRGKYEATRLRRREAMLSGSPRSSVLPPSSVATPCLNANVSWPACVGERH